MTTPWLQFVLVMIIDHCFGDQLIIRYKDGDNVDHVLHNYEKGKWFRDEETGGHV